MRRLILSCALLCSLALCSLTPAVAAEKVKKPFCGHCLHDWTAVKSDWPNKWVIGTVAFDAAKPTELKVEKVKKGDIPCMINAVPGNWTADPRQGVDFYTQEQYGDCKIKLEFLITKNSNSGIYLMGRYELQIADSFGVPDDQLKESDMGALYSAATAKTNGCAEPGTWQKYEIDFVAPKFDAQGNKTANARFAKVVLNGKVLHENVELKGATPGGLGSDEVPTGPLMIQGNHGPIALRNIEVIVNE